MQLELTFIITPKHDKSRIKIALGFRFICQKHILGLAMLFLVQFSTDSEEIFILN